MQLPMFILRKKNEEKNLRICHGISGTHHLVLHLAVIAFSVNIIEYYQFFISLHLIINATYWTQTMKVL